MTAGREMTDEVPKCSHGIPLSHKFCRGCRLILVRRQLENAKRDVEQFCAQIAVLENTDNSLWK